MFNKKKVKVMDLTEKEKELINALRNYKRGYPRSKQLLGYALALFWDISKEK